MQAPTQTPEAQTREQLRGERQRQILDAAMNAFSQHGFHGTDVEDVAHRAGVGKGTVYRHFGNKSELFLTLLEWALDSLTDEILARTKKIESPFEKISVAIDICLDFFQERRSFYRVLIQEKDALASRAEQRFEAKCLSYLHLLEATLAAGVEEGLFRRIDVGSTAMALVGIVHLLIYKWLMSEQEYPLRREKQTIMDTFFWGIVSGPGAAPESAKRAGCAGPADTEKPSL